MSRVERRNPRLPGGFSLPPFEGHQMLALVIVSIALWGLGLLWLAMVSGEQWISTWQRDIRFHVYVNEASADIGVLRERLKSIPGVGEVRQIEKGEAARWVEEWLGDTGLDHVELAGALPLSLEILPDDDAPEHLFGDIRDEAERIGAKVNDEEAFLANAHAWLGELRAYLAMITSLIALAIAVIIANTLRMTLLARQDEVHLMRLMGAHEGFVRLPFILEGVVIGTVAGFVAWLLTLPLVIALESWMAAAGIHIHVITILPECLGLGFMVGLVGSLIATARIVSPEEI
ncbi:MAG: FtsX-like permease family protein [Mariprofundaceae bacterium]